PERVEVDRAIAIRYAVEQAATNDINLIAGKGHENYQDVQGVKHHFSDFEIAEKALAERC
ncbi:UDP-N-acetylmuramoyl-L-alanyl-D-glutamate--2,6-diaminopimelate ligase, partial [Neisseria sp. P0001.S009]